MALSAQDNTYAERINKTIKEAYLQNCKPKNDPDLKKCVDKAANHYNNDRPQTTLVNYRQYNLKRNGTKIV